MTTMNEILLADVPAIQGLTFRHFREEHFQGWIKWKWFRPELFRVTWDVEKNEIAGAVENFINEDENAKYNRKRGYTEGICVRRPYRKRGLARALIALSLQMHKDMGMTGGGAGRGCREPHWRVACIRGVRLPRGQAPHHLSPAD